MKNKQVEKSYFGAHLEKLLSARNHLLKEGKINVTQAAKEIGISQPTLKRIIDGSENITPKNERAILDYLKTSKSDFFKYDDDNMHNLVREDAAPYQVAREQLLSLNEEEFSDIVLFCEFLSWRKQRDSTKS